MVFTALTSRLSERQFVVSVNLRGVSRAAFM
jgi:hypothetical protein